MLERVFISGATGLLGTHVLCELMTDDIEILALYRSESSLNEVRELVDYYQLGEHWNKIQWVQGDVHDIDRLQDCISTVSKVYHCAAMVSFDPSDSVPLHYINVIGTKNLVDVSLECGVEKFLHVSSTAAIGSPDKGEISRESTKWKNEDAASYYAKSKYSSEREVWRGMEEGLNAVIVNPCVIVGPGDPNKSSGTVFSTMAKGLKFYTSGSNAFVDARDVSKIMKQLMNSDIHSQRFLCVGENLSFKEFFELIADEMKIARPKYAANKFMTELAWRLLWIYSKISNSSPGITSESARASHRVKRFSNQK